MAMATLASIPREDRRARVQTELVDAQWIVLVLALVLLVYAGPRPRMTTAIGAVLGFAVAGVLLFVLSHGLRSGICRLIPW